MSKVCDLSGKKVQFGNNVSKANNKTRRKFNPNMQSTTFKSDLLNKNIRFNVATSSIRTVTKFGGIDEFLIRTKSKKLSLKAKRIRKTLQRVDGRAN
jgi:large subunit ribosomal protein L28